MNNIEDTISRNKKFQEEQKNRLEKLKDLGAPEYIINTAEKISKMTLDEYKIYCQELDKEDNAIKSEYAKHNPIQKNIVDEIYNRECVLNYDYFTYSSGIGFMRAIDPLSFMSKDDFENDLYISFLEHAKEIYRDRFKQNYENQRIESA